MESNQERKRDNFLSIDNLLNPTSQLATETTNLNKVEEKDWTNIHSDFALKPWREKWNYQQIWQEFGITYQEMSKWLQANLKVNDYELVAYSRGKGYQSNNINEEALRKEYENWKGQAKTAQEYLNSIYPLEIRNNVKLLNIDGKNLTDFLVLKDFPNLVELNCSHNKLTELLNLSNHSELTLLGCSGNNNLTELNLNNCSQLTKLKCWDGNLTNLTITNCPNLTELNCWNNQLTTPNFLITDKEKLTELNISKNKFTGDLTFLTEFTNLEELDISKNKFTGSLEPLKNYLKLKKLNLESTKFTSGLEYLPASLEKVIYSNVSKELHKELAPYGGNFNSWREARAKDQQIALLQQEQTQFSKQEQEISYLEKRIQELTELIKQQKEKIISIFLRLSPEKELVQQLITANLEFIRFKKQTDQPGYSKKKREYERSLNTIKDELLDELPEETSEEIMDKIEAILTDCEELVRDEIELDTKLKEKFRLIEEHYQSSLQITDNPEESNKRKRIINAEEATQQEQVIQFKRVRSNSLITEMAKLQGERDAYKVLALASNTPIINNTNSSSNNMNDNSATYHNSKHNEFLHNQFQVPPKQ